MGSNNDTIIADVGNLTQEDLVDLYEKLALDYSRIKQENDEIREKFHQSKQQTKMLLASQNDLQNELDSINGAHQEDLAEVTKNNANIVESWKVRNQEVQNEKIQLETKVDELTSKLEESHKLNDDLKLKLSRHKPPPRISDTFLLNLERDNEQLQQMINEMQEKFANHTQQMSEKNEELGELQEKIRCLEDNLESKKADIEEKNDAIEGLQEKFHELSVELAILRSAPEDANRKGNSLFAEVDDQRQKMKTMLQGERSHYLEMKRAANAKEIEIRRLRRENTNIKLEIQACSNLLMRGEQAAMETLTSHVAQLRQDNRKLEQALASTEKRLFDLAQEQSFDWIESVLSTANNETRELKDKLFRLLLDQTAIADNLQKNQRELAKARLDCVKFRILLGRIIDGNNIKINERDFYDIGLEQEVIESLKVDEFEIVDDEATAPMFDEGALNESTIELLGGRARLGNMIPQISPEQLRNHDNKENIEVVQLSAPETVQLPSPKPVQSPAKPMKNLQAIVQQNKSKSVKFSEVTDTRVIDSTQEGFEQSKQARKRPGVVVKRFVITSKASAKKLEEL